MGAGILKQVGSLEDFIKQKSFFEKKHADYNNKCFYTWKIDEKECLYLQWPYKFESSKAYIFMVVSTAQIDRKQLLNQWETPIQFGQMLFGIQFLQKYLEKNKIVSNRHCNKQEKYRITIYLYCGDNLEIGKFLTNKSAKQEHISDEFSHQSMIKTKAVYYFDRLYNCIQQIGLYLAFNALNKVNTSKYQKDEAIIFDKNYLLTECCLEYVDLKLSHYQYVGQSCIVNRQLYSNKLKQQNYLQKAIQIIDNKQKDFETLDLETKQKNNQVNGFEIDQSLPFACQITQIESKKIKNPRQKLEESNYFLNQLGIPNSVPQKIQCFLKGIYLATEKVSRNFQLINDHKIKLIINCAPEVCQNWFINDIDYKWIFIPDPLKNLSNHQVPHIQCIIYQIAQTLVKYLVQDFSVMFHCADYDGKTEYAGSRSAVVLIGVIMVSLNVSFDEAYKIINKKWNILIPDYFQKQLKLLQWRRKNQPKIQRIFGIGSYQQKNPQHVVAKYLFETQNITNLQGIQNYSEMVFLSVGKTNKIHIGPSCNYKKIYEIKARQYFKLLLKYELPKSHSSHITAQFIQKTFRKPQKVICHKILAINPEQTMQQRCFYKPGFERNEPITFKYPILRPIWQKKKKQDGFYFVVQLKNQNDRGTEQVVANITMIKGAKWCGIQEQKDKFLKKIISLYLKDISDDNIYIYYEEEGDKSLFDESVFEL